MCADDAGVVVAQHGLVVGEWLPILALWKEAPMGIPEHSDSDKPVKPPLGVPPPAVTLLLLGVGLGIHFASPQTILPEGWVQFAVGIPVIAVGLGFGMRAIAAFSHAGTDDRFAKATSVIVTTGLNARTRNPMYMGLTLIYLGLVLTINAVWALVGLPVLVLYLHFGVIRREERYLEDRFGDEYMDYKASVPRWIPQLVNASR